MRNDALVRVLRLAALLAGTREGITLPAAAALLGVTTRTIRRDVATLRAVDLVVESITREYDTDEPHLWRLAAGAPCPLCRNEVHLS